ncbi:MAG: hypothetical protein RR951_06775, partial [Ruthenibacterium sp.]
EEIPEEAEPPTEEIVIVPQPKGEENVALCDRTPYERESESKYRPSTAAAEDHLLPPTLLAPSAAKKLKTEQQPHSRIDLPEDTAQEQGPTQRMEEAQVQREYQTRIKRLRGALLGCLAVGVMVIAGIALAVGTSNTRKIYDYIATGSYGLAYEAIGSKYEKGQNVDSLAKAFIDAAIEKRQYRHILPLITMLSENAVAEDDYAYVLSIAKKISGIGEDSRLSALIAQLDAAGGEYAAAAQKIEKDKKGKP